LFEVLILDLDGAGDMVDDRWELWRWKE